MIDLYIVYTFLKRLTTPFDQWKAYDLGIIDAEGNVLRKRRDLMKVEEREAFTTFDLMILKLKRLLAKVPGGNTRLGTYAAALWLIREHNLIAEKGETLSEEYIEEQLREVMQNINEEVGAPVPANSAGAGNVAGIGVGPKGEPGVSKKTQKKIQKNGGTVLRRFRDEADK